MKTIIIVDQDKIDNYEETAEVFFKAILDMDLKRVMITDLSTLSDFSGCGMSEAQYDVALTNLNLEGLSKQEKAQKIFNEIGNYWDKIVIEKIKDKYSIEIISTTISLLDLFEQLEKIRSVH